MSEKNTLTATDETRARMAMAFGYFFTLGEWAEKTLPTEEINEAIDIAMAYKFPPAA